MARLLCKQPSGGFDSRLLHQGVNAKVAIDLRRVGAAGSIPATSTNGDEAQMEERLAGSQKVTGSTPVVSTRNRDAENGIPAVR